MNLPAHAEKVETIAAFSSADPLRPGSARASRAVSGASPETRSEAWYSKRRLPHFERPWEKYAIAFSTCERRPLSPRERDIVLRSAVHAHEHGQCELYVACVMPDHVHLLLEPQIKGDMDGKTFFWSLSEILHGIKSSTAHRINKHRAETGPVWEKESFDRKPICRKSSNIPVGILGTRTSLYERNIIHGCGRKRKSSAGAPKAAREGACAPQTR
jgi:REP element-mobilizing transposase RayT